MNHYNKKLPNTNSIIVGEIYYKNPIPMGFPSIRLYDIIIHSHLNGLCIVTIGKENKTQEIKEDEALAYINAFSGYSNES